MPKIKDKKSNKKALKKPKKVKKVVAVKKVVSVKKEVKPNSKTDRYFEGVGRRKTSVARVRLFAQGGKDFVINDKSIDNYIPMPELKQKVLSPLERMNCLERFKISVKVSGGGVHSQAEAIRHGISKALLLVNPDFRKKLKKSGFLTRDSRMRERKKFGLKRARKAPQWKKR